MLSDARTAGVASAASARSPEFRLLLEKMEDHGAIELADVMAGHFASQLAPGNDIEVLRLLALRARFAWKLGRVESAEKFYRVIERSGADLENDELRARAWIGRSIIGLLRGNYPDARVWVRRATTITARPALHGLHGLAHSAAVPLAAAGGDVTGATMHAWQAWQAWREHPSLADDALILLARALLDAGEASMARACFASILGASPKWRRILPALGGYALACATSARPIQARAALAQLQRVEPTRLPFELASACLDAALATRALQGTRDEVASWSDRAVRLAVAHGYHELVYRAEQLQVAEDTRPAVPRPPRAVPLPDTVRESIRAIEPEDALRITAALLAIA
ncbi:MAG: hypothetical protein H0W68_00080 [Gemmatimonadaceae bacterium]|nr:hypothetical protein [Gemmatimonadaceae bacterium]